jgi:succinate dehydrogenase / fumarate reductase cytochrome b subunit
VPGVGARHWLGVFLTSSVGQKAVMAVTGVILVLYVIVHLLGNLQVFQGEEHLNAYAQLLRLEPPLLWTARVILFAAAALHVIFGVRLWLQNRSARPVPYACRSTVKASIASRTMIYTGLVVLGFVVYHVLHLTLGTVGPSGYEFEHGNVYRNLVRGFQDPLISGLYIVGQIFLYVHLSHGIQSMFKTLGASHPKYERGVERLGGILALLLAVGNIALPLVVLFGVVR